MKFQHAESPSRSDPTVTLTPRFAVLAGLIAFAVGERLVVHFVPGLIPYNFTPVEAIALFGGAYFADRRLAIMVPLAAMLLADLIIGLHALIPVVYGCIALTAIVAARLRGRTSVMRVATYGVASATLFFAVTNFAVWATSGMYPLTGAGLVACFVAAIPFFPGTLAGTLFWSALLFGGFELMCRQWPALEAAPNAT
ncbi:MAG: DUF6580 family putative transport protein [Rhodanobacteraceae bacterium]